MSLSCLFHVHTRHSFDSILPSAKIVAVARRLKVDLLIVTDHNTIQGSLNVRGLAGPTGPAAIVAAEYQSEKGDIIGLFLQEEIRSRSSTEIVAQIHAQGGLVVLPHPYKGHVLDQELLAGVDLIEAHNARCTQADNGSAQQLAERLNLPTLAGADAHCSLELSSAITQFEADLPATTDGFREILLRAPRQFTLRDAPAYCRPYSQMIKAAKTRSPRLFAYQFKRFAGALFSGRAS